MTHSTDTSYTYEQCLVNDILDSTDLLNEHRAAVTQYECGEFSPDRAAFNLLQDVGMLVSLSAKHDGDIVGYCMIHVSNSLHQPSAVRGIVDNIYVNQAHRGHCGTKFIAFVSKHLLSFGVTDLYHLVPTCYDWGLVLKRQGFVHVENVYHKGL
jgi:hypothetical protein